jgi:predicted outer membrane repeat protein
MHVMFNTTEGQVSFNSFNTAGSLIIRGEGSIVAPMVTGELGLGVSESRLLEVDATVGRTLSFHMSNITISSFGSDTIEGGAVRLVDLAAGSMSNVVFRNNSGSSGGAVFMDDSPGFRFVDCVFDSNSALNDGGGLLISTASSGVQVEACVFTGNRVRDGMGGGIYILNNNNDIFIDRCNFTQNFAVRG